MVRPFESVISAGRDVGVTLGAGVEVLENIWQESITKVTKTKKETLK